MPSNRCCKSCALPVVYLPLVTFSFTCSRWDILLILLLLLPVELPTRWRSIAIKCHNAADLNDVTSGVWFRQPAHHHVRISNCLHLTIRTLHFARTSRPEQKLRLVRSAWTDSNCQNIIREHQHSSVRIQCPLSKPLDWKDWGKERTFAAKMSH